MAHIRRRGSKWQARYRGTDRKERAKTFERKVDAEQWLSRQMSDISRGTWLDPAGAQLTFAEWWPTYNEQAGKRESTAYRDQGAADNWLLPRLGQRRLGEITPQIARQVVTDMQDAGLAPSTVRTYYGVLQGAMTAAVAMDLIGRSPCRGIKISGERREEPKFLTIDELAHLADSIDPNYRAMVVLAGVVGLRFGECAGLRVGKINFFKRTVTVSEIVNEVGSKLVFGEPKTKSSKRTVSFPKEVGDVLAAHLSERAPVQPDDLVFVSPTGHPVRRKHFRNRVWLPAVKKAGVEDLTFHGLRHSAVGYLIELGTHPRVIQKRMGHSSIRTTMDIYGSVLDHVDEEVTDGLGDLISKRRGRTAVEAVNDETPSLGVVQLTRGYVGGDEGDSNPWPPRCDRGALAN